MSMHKGSMGLVLSVALLAGCAYVPRAGDVLQVRRDAVAQAAPGGEMPKPREAFKEKPGLVLPEGATVEVIGEYDKKGRPVGADADGGGDGRWVRVRVKASPVAAQNGRDGWVHLETVERGGEARSALAGRMAQVAEEAPLCGSPAATQETCAQRVPAGSSVRTVRCDAGSVQIEYWDAQGLYVTGYVPEAKVSGEPCKVQHVQIGWSGAGIPGSPPPGALKMEASFRESPAETEAFIQQWTEGYQAEGAEISGLLENMYARPLQLEAGKCYAIAVRFGADAYLNSDAKGHVSVLLQQAGDQRRGRGPNTHGPGGVGSAGCARSAGEALFDLRADGSPIEKGRSHMIGVGAFKAQLYSKAVPAASMAAEESAWEGRVREHYRQRKERDAASCETCLNKRERCRNNYDRFNPKNCDTDFTLCVRRSVNETST